MFHSINLIGGFQRLHDNESDRAISSDEYVSIAAEIKTGSRQTSISSSLGKSFATSPPDHHSRTVIQ